MPRVDFAVVGAPKSATTFMHQALRSHPDVHMDAGENAAFFNNKWPETLAPFFARAEELGKRLCGVKRPDLMFNHRAAERMAAHNPFMKCIAVLRHPVERAVAHYFHLVGYSFLPLLDFEEGIRRILYGELAQQWPRSSEVLRFSRYRSGIERYAQLFGTSSTLLLTHDEVAADALGTTHRVCDFLGLDPAAGLTLPTERHQKVMYSLERLRFLRHLNEGRMILDELGRGKGFNRPFTEIDHAWVQMVRQFDLTRMKDIPNVPPRLREATWKILHAHFRDDIEYVESALGTPLPAWHRNPLA